jgi:hypothetical protein
VLDRCRIRWGTVVDLDPLTVSSPRLTWDGAALGLAEPTAAPVEGDGVSVGDEVAVHWDRLVDVLRPDQAATLVASTEARLAATNARLAVAAG